MVPGKMHPAQETPPSKAQAKAAPLALIGATAAWVAYGIGEACRHPAIGAALAFAFGLAGLLLAPASWRTKPIEAVSALFFGIELVGVAWLGFPPLVRSERFLAPALFFTLAFGSLLVRRPFTLPYAREVAPPEAWGTPEFRRVNVLLTLCWGGFFLLSAVVKYHGLRHAWPEWAVGAVNGALLGGMLLFTKKFPEWHQARLQKRSASATVNSDPHAR